MKNYVLGCGTCQQFKIDWNPSKPAFLPTEGSQSTRPFSYCSMDLITDLPPADDFDSILVMVDQVLIKGVILIPCKKTITAKDTGEFLLENLYKWFGLTDKIISDRGPQFASNSFKELLKLLNIKSALSTVYHPQTDGTTECVNQEIKAYLSIYCTTHPDEWPTALHLLEFTHNNWRHADCYNCIYTRTIYFFFFFTFTLGTTCYESMFFYFYYSSCITRILHASDAWFSYMPFPLCWTHVEHVLTMRYAHVFTYIKCS